MCLNPLMISFMTVGQFPVFFPNTLHYKFDEIQEAQVLRKEFDLKIVKRYWFWDMFVFNKSLKQKAGSCLLANYYKH